MMFYNLIWVDETNSGLTGRFLCLEEKEEKGEGILSVGPHPLKGEDCRALRLKRNGEAKQVLRSYCTVKRVMV
jgi:hypothetical protein